MKRFLSSLYLQVLVAVALGALLGFLNPSLGAAMKPLGDGFIKLVKMLIAPIVFATVVTGIAKMGDLKRVGRIGLKAIVYFEVLTTFALAIGLLVGKLVQPGAGMNVDAGGARHQRHRQLHLVRPRPQHHRLPAQRHPQGRRRRLRARRHPPGAALLDPLRRGARGASRRKGPLVLRFVEELSHVLFRIVAIVMRLAPIGAFGAMAFTVGKYGIGEPAQPRQADGDLLRHQPAVRARSSSAWCCAGRASTSSTSCATSARRS